MTSDSRYSIFFKILILSLALFPIIRGAGFFEYVQNAVEDFTCKHLSCCSYHLKPSKERSEGSQLADHLRYKLFGQHLVKDVIAKAISQHMSRPTYSELFHDFIVGEYSPKKKTADKIVAFKKRIKEDGGSLNIWMYGQSGTGKSYTVEIIAESIYKEGLRSPLVHYFPGKSSLSMPEVLEWIRGNLSSCQSSMFIFDEFNELPISFIYWILKTSLEDYYRDAIFIFIMNSGDSALMENMLRLYEEGKTREDISLEDVQDSGIAYLTSYLKKKFGENNQYMRYLQNEIKNVSSGISAPFLPLEKQHVKSCIIHHLINLSGVYPSVDFITNVHNGVTYGPEGKELFSLHGCKHIHTFVVSALAHQKKMENHKEL